ncbi:MAG: F0F1 ATP synthase subunit alpha, partial [Candidatus Pacebacteria bacterium]|nr:F0F1 ATP synthase subunit alpha [Candidatus Paceibacterota bacterium]
MKKQDQLQALLGELIAGANITTTPESVGTIMSFGDGVIRVRGLDAVQAGELVDIGEGQFGLALSLEKEQTAIVALGSASHISTGQTVKRTGQILSIPVSDDIIGRTVNPLGTLLDGGKTLTKTKNMVLEKIAPGVMARQSVSVPLQTGIKAIDAMIPIGRGQRELIIGDRATGKTAVALGTILNQADQNVTCVYVCIGQKRSNLAQITATLRT